ncbi:MAG TPA: MBL fold metallo-hydrolase, partial [Bryobacteraceae bacterium]|nr:MBL fold metallo-hydrolase [Bryobacteraceae bacterium]
ATLVATEKTRILIDAGLSFRELSGRLAGIGEEPARLDAVLISHEHSDHVSGLPVLMRKLGFRVPVYATKLTAPTLSWDERAPRVETFQAGCRFSIGDVDVDSFTIPHDAVDPVAFAFHTQGLKTALVTDLGYIPESVKYHLRGAQLLILESNHDLEMLKVGPYPWLVKQRVMGRKGHLSNDVVSDFIREDLSTDTATLILGHLSENNNHPELVRLAAAQALMARALSVKLAIAEPRRQTEVFTL